MNLIIGPIQVVGATNYKPTGERLALLALRFLRGRFLCTGMLAGLDLLAGVSRLRRALWRLRGFALRFGFAGGAAVSTWALLRALLCRDRHDCCLFLPLAALARGYPEFLPRVRRLRLPSVRDPVWEEAVAVVVAERRA